MPLGNALVSTTLSPIIPFTRNLESSTAKLPLCPNCTRPSRMVSKFRIHSLSASSSQPPPHHTLSALLTRRLSKRNRPNGAGTEANALLAYLTVSKITSKSPSYLQLVVCSMQDLKSA